MGDKSPKSKQRDQNQKSIAKQDRAAKAKSKQDQQSSVPAGGKGRK